MSFEKILTPEEEKDIPKITTEEWLKYSGGDKDDEAFQQWIKEKGIELNDGNVKIDLNGEVVVIDTKEGNFGQIIQEPDAIDHN
ncbi:MAG: hypothetical protein KAS91_00210 [Candidatus Pacebacteria bacterium]|nr:hypothetical protein [Candidatus Paceibacterota bacterium]